MPPLRAVTLDAGATAPSPAACGARPSLRLCDVEDPAGGRPGLFAGLSERERRHVEAQAVARTVRAGEAVFRQGDRHEGIYVILSGAVRVFYTAPSGREITLAYWSPGNFVGGPELYGQALHVWSGMAVRDAELLGLRGEQVRRLVREVPAFASNLVEALVEKSRCFSAVIRMLGTRSVTGRLAHLLLAIGSFDATPTPRGLLLGRPLTHEELAKMVGATRQWVSTSLERFRAQGLVEVRRHRIVLRDEHGLRDLADDAREAIR